MRMLSLSICLCGTIALMMTVPSAQVFAETDPSFQPLPYKLNRADEDYRYLRDSATRADFWDPVKYVPLNESGIWYLSLGGEARERYEYFNHPNWGAGPPGSGYLLQRYFLHADLHMGEHLRLFTQLQSSFENDRNGGPRPTDKDELDLHQAFLDVKFDLSGDNSFLLRSGRQELFYGSQRIISVREGPNVRQSFDGFRAMFHTGDIAVDAFAARPVETKRYVFDDGTDNSRGLWGVYSVMPLSMLPKGNVDLYYLGYHNRDAGFNQGSASETRHSVGARLWRTAKPIDYNFEFIYQWGEFGNGDIHAWTAASDTGYTFDSLTFHPRLGLKADITSGDRDPHSPNLQSFNPLFPKGAYFSEDALIGPINHIDVNPSIDLHFTRSVTLSLNWDFFWRESVHDGLYNSGLSLVRSANNSSAHFVGSQPQAVFEWDIDRHLTLVAIYAHFFAGTFLQETGPSKDIDYTTAWLSYRF